MASYKSLAESPVIVILAYTVAFIPWVVLYATDVISFKMKPIREARIAAGLHLILTLLPLGYVVYYADLQRRANDYKEMMVAVLAILFCLFNVARSIWGLLQLVSFRQWCDETVKKMEILGMELKREESVDVSVEVNENVVDNEFPDKELKVRFSPGFWNKKNHRLLTTKDPINCSIRWVGCFLRAYGSQWHGDGDEYNLFYLFDRSKKSLRSLLDVTVPIPMIENNNEMTLFSIADDFKDSNVMKLLNGPYGAEISEFNLFKTFNRSSVDAKGISYLNIPQLIDSVMIANHLPDDKLKAIQSEHGQFESRTQKMALNAWQILVWQQKETNYVESLSEVPVFPWMKLMLPLWKHYTNKRVLQATGFLDVQFALEVGEAMTNRRKLSLSEALACFGGNANSNKERFKIEKGWKKMTRFSGCALETVRSFFAEWLTSEPHSQENVNWTPKIECAKVTFTVSQFVANRLKDEKAHIRLKTRLVWECQLALQENVAKIVKAGSHCDLPAVSELIMMFLTAFPILNLKQTDPGARNSTDVYVFEIDPCVDVQNVWLELQILGDESRKATLRLVRDLSTSRFRWEDWVNAALGIYRGIDNVSGAENIDTWSLHKFKKVDLGMPVVRIPFDSMPSHCYDVDCDVWRNNELITSNCRGPNQRAEPIQLPPDELLMWTGWPMFNSYVAQFEINQWIEKCGTNPRLKVDRTLTTSTSIDEQVEYAQTKLKCLVDWILLYSSSPIALRNAARQDIEFALKAGKLIQNPISLNNASDCLSGTVRNVPKKLFDNFVRDSFCANTHPQCVTLESVRTFICKWLDSKSLDPSTVDWEPKISNEEFSVEIGEAVCSQLAMYIHVLKPDEQLDSMILKKELIWEAQTALRTELNAMMKGSSNLPASKELMMLCITAFPVLAMNWKREARTADRYWVFIIQAMVDVQNVQLELRFNNQVRKLSLRLTTKQSADKFHWQEWVTGALGITKGHDLWYNEQKSSTNSDDFSRNDWWNTNRVDLKKKMMTLKIDSLPVPYLCTIPAPGDFEKMSFWLGWPTSSSLICQYEVDQWLHAFNLGDRWDIANVRQAAKVYKHVEDAEKIVQYISSNLTVKQSSDGDNSQEEEKSPSGDNSEEKEKLPTGGNSEEKEKSPSGEKFEEDDSAKTGNAIEKELPDQGEKSVQTEQVEVEKSADSSAEARSGTEPDAAVVNIVSADASNSGTAENGAAASSSGNVC